MICHQSLSKEQLFNLLAGWNANKIMSFLDYLKSIVHSIAYFFEEDPAVSLHRYKLKKFEFVKKLTWLIGHNDSIHASFSTRFGVVTWTLSSANFRFVNKARRRVSHRTLFYFLIFNTENTYLGNLRWLNLPKHNSCFRWYQAFVMVKGYFFELML